MYHHLLYKGHDKLGPGRNESHQERDRAEARKREEVEQESHDALSPGKMDVQEWDNDGIWDKGTQTVHTGELVADFLMKRSS